MVLSNSMPDSMIGGWGEIRRIGSETKSRLHSTQSFQMNHHYYINKGCAEYLFNSNIFCWFMIIYTTTIKIVFIMGIVRFLFQCSSNNLPQVLTCLWTIWWMVWTVLDCNAHFALYSAAQWVYSTNSVQSQDWMRLKTLQRRRDFRRS